MPRKFVLSHCTWMQEHSLTCSSITQTCPASLLLKIMLLLSYAEISKAEARDTHGIYFDFTPVSVGKGITHS